MNEHECGEQWAEMYWYEVRYATTGKIVVASIRTRHAAYDELDTLRETFPYAKFIAVRVEKI